MSRAREAGRGAPRPSHASASRGPMHPDQQVAAERSATRSSRYSAARVEVRSAGTAVPVELTVESLADALELARRLRVRAAA